MKRTLFCIVFLFLLSVLAMSRQLTTDGYFSVIKDDSLCYMSWAWQFADALKEGIIYPRWLPLNFWGYGSPTFIIYSPLAYYLVAFFNLFTHSIAYAMNLCKFVALFITAYGMFLFVRQFYSDKIALLTASFYILLPYNITQLYLMESFAGIISNLWFCPVLLFIYKYINFRQPKYLLYAGICYGGLILTHLVNAYMFTFVIFAFIFFYAVKKRQHSDILLLLPVIVTGVLISAAYLLPLLFEKTLISLKREVSADYTNFFILPNMTHKLPADIHWLVYYPIFAFTTICLLIILSILIIIAFKTARVSTVRDRNWVNNFSLATSISSLFLLFGPSKFLWETIPLFSVVGYPTRWLNVSAFALSILSASGFAFLSDHVKSSNVFVTISASLFLIFILLDSHYISKAPIFYDADLDLAKAVNGYEEYLPDKVQLNKIDKDTPDKEKVLIVDGKGNTDILLWKSAERVLDVNADEPLVVRFRTFNFPGWTAYLDGTRKEIKTEAATGAILLDVPGGRHRVRLVFSDTAVRLAGKLISLVSAIVLIVILAMKKIGPGKEA